METIDRFALIAVFWVTTTSFGAAGDEVAVRTADRLGLALSSTGALTGLSVDGRELLPPDRDEFYPVSICDVVKGAEFVPTRGTCVLQEDGILIHQAECAQLALQATARCQAGKERLTVRLHVEDTTGKDRGLLVRFALPIRAEGWLWWNDMETARSIEKSGTYEHCRRIREFAALPEWSDKPSLNMGAHSVNFCNVLTGPVGLCYAVPLDQPRIFRTGYDAEQQLFYIVYDVALAKETKPSGAADLTFYVYRCDPNWGMRSALDRYYRFFPEFFTKHVERDGMWMAFSKLSEVDHPNEFRFAFQEGAPEPDYDDRLDIQSLTYFTHAGQFADIPDYTPETDPEPTYEKQLAAVRAKFQRTTGSGDIFDACGLYDAQGRLAVKRATVYGHVLAQYNLDPHFAYGRHMLDKIPSVFHKYRERQGGELDGFYYDGLTTGINYRRNHFPSANHPPIWDPLQQKPFLYNYFSSIEFAKEVAERLHAQGKITMMNGAMGSSFYTAPYLDVMGAETGLRIDRTSFNYVRTICRQKPFVTLLKGNFSRLTKDDMALFMKRCVAYGVFPGFFDWPPSGLGPGSRYWDHAQWYERDRPNHRKYQALCQQLARAGWEPLTLARSSNPGLALERFGTAAEGEVFLTVLNDDAAPAETVVVISPEALPDDPVLVDEVSSCRLTAAKMQGDGLEVPLRLEPESLVVLHVASVSQLAGSHLDEIRENLALRSDMWKVNKERAESLVHWRGTRYGAYERDNVDGRSCLKLANQSPGQTKGATQWVMLYQEEPDPLTLRVRLKSDRVAPKGEGSLHVDAVMCHVNMTTRFTERTRKRFDLDTGTYAWREVEILIEPERPLRSIQLSPYLWRSAGTVWIDHISITPVDAQDHEFVVDPTMEQWYERPSDDCAQGVEARFAQLEAGLEKLKEPGADLVADNYLSVLQQVREQQKWIEDNGYENPCRRELRELDDLTTRLSLVCSTLMGVDGPHVDAPAVVVPGEEVTVRIRVNGAEQWKVDHAVQVSGESSSPGAPSQRPWSCEPEGHGRFRITVPRDAMGTTAGLMASAAIRSPSGLTLPLQKATTIRVAPAIEAAMRLVDVSASGDRFHLVVAASNNCQAPIDVLPSVRVPEGWRTDGPLDGRTLDAKRTERLDFFVTPPNDARPGPYPIAVELRSRKSEEPLVLSETVSFLPASLNLLNNPGFEAPGTAKWSTRGPRCNIDTAQFHEGKRSLQLSNASANLRSSAWQTITLNRDVARPIIVRGHARAEDVSGHPDRGFSLYVDIYYTDGSALYGQTVDWQTGTTDWQYGETTIEPAKPIRNVNVYLLLRGHSGTAWFDDLFVAEAPAR